MFQLFEKLPIVFFNRKEFKDLINLKSNLFIARLNSFSLWELSVCATIQCVVWLIRNFLSFEIRAVVSVSGLIYEIALDLWLSCRKYAVALAVLPSWRTIWHLFQGPTPKLYKKPWQIRSYWIKGNLKHSNRLGMETFQGFRRWAETENAKLGDRLLWCVERYV